MTPKHRYECDILTWSHLRDCYRRSGAPSAAFPLPPSCNFPAIKIDITAFKYQIIVSPKGALSRNPTRYTRLQRPNSIGQLVNFSVSSQEKIVGESALVGYHYTGWKKSMFALCTYSTRHKVDYVKFYITQTVVSMSCKVCRDEAFVTHSIFILVCSFLSGSFVG